MTKEIYEISSPIVLQNPKKQNNKRKENEKDSLTSSRTRSEFVPSRRQHRLEPRELEQPMYISRSKAGVLPLGNLIALDLFPDPAPEVLALVRWKDPLIELFLLRALVHKAAQAAPVAEGRGAACRVSVPAALTAATVNTFR